MAAFLTPELEEPFLKPLDDEEVRAFPASACLDIFVVKPSKGLMRSPLDADPFNRVRSSLVVLSLDVLDGQFAVYVVLNLPDRRVPATFCTILSPRSVGLLEPVRYLENVPGLKLFVLVVDHELLISRPRLLLHRFCELPLEDLFVGHHWNVYV